MRLPPFDADCTDLPIVAIRYVPNPYQQYSTKGASVMKKINDFSQYKDILSLR